MQVYENPPCRQGGFFVQSPAEAVLYSPKYVVIFAELMHKNKKSEKSA